MQLNGKNKVLPFEDFSFLVNSCGLSVGPFPSLPHSELRFHPLQERMCRKYDCSMFIVGGHSKKRPHNLVFGRLHDWELLDMYEVGISRFEAIADLAEETVTLGTKPCLVFSGEFDDDEELKVMKSFLIGEFEAVGLESRSSKCLMSVWSALSDCAT